MTASTRRKCIERLARKDLITGCAYYGQDIAFADRSIHNYGTDWLLESFGSKYEQMTDTELQALILGQREDSDE